MNVKKAIKRIVALGTGATLMGATVLGAMAADLSDFPAPFVENGRFNAQIVVGAAASTPDVIGSVDIATTLQYAMREAAGSTGGASTVTVSGDSTQLTLSNDNLAIGDFVGDVISNLDEEDLEALKEESFSDQDYDQEINLPNGTGLRVSWFDEGGDYFEEEPDFYMTISDGAELYTYTMDFGTSPDSDIDDQDDLEDFEDETMTIMGMSYNVVDTDISVGSNGVKFTLMGGDATGVLEEGQTKTFTVNGRDYEVSAPIISTGEEVQFTVDGETLNPLEEGDTEELEDGTEIGVRSVLVNDGEGASDLVTFYLGADSIVLEDTDYTDPNSGAQDLEVGDETYNNVEVSITGSDDTDTFSLDMIELTVVADDDYYLQVGDRLSDYIDGEEEDYLFGNFDVLFEGMSSPTLQEVTIEPSGTDKYVLDVETSSGQDVEIPIWYVASGAGVGRPGDDDGAFWAISNDTTSNVFTM